uniref:Reverse transcriptase Ty1/copia-type domain-containing protein n=1 Tax=Peronospora matthiolae TaxID=2874970 RepID=A0AAV1ULI8_9STRA
MHGLEVKDLGLVTKFLGMGVSYDDKIGYALEQNRCIRELLATTGLDLANPTRTPTGEDQDGEGEGDLLPRGSGGTAKQPTIATFQSLIGSLLWIARCTRPDIAFAVY